MSAVWYMWMGIFSLLLVAFLLSVWSTKKRGKYALYFVTGVVFGLYFDTISFFSGYYSYPDIFPVTFFGLPLSMTIAEGFSVAITIRAFEAVKVFLKNLYKSSK